ncbi:unnamed protein product [Blepharisma stoltei]|uniref:Uncharacterized protein n=1 Tax=Blepharisma stoltei TaxID=1481888 RepID=A0AAU9J1J2_9CILI|nr:unnamed protein product [Blepharisma stoltei]
MDIDVHLIRKDNLIQEVCQRSMKLRKLKRWYIKSELKRDPNWIIFLFSPAHDSPLEPILKEDIELGDLIPEGVQTLSLYIDENPLLLKFDFGLIIIEYLYQIDTIGELKEYILYQLCFYLDDKLIFRDENHQILSKAERISNLILKFGAPLIYIECARKNYSKDRKRNEFDPSLEESFLELFEADLNKSTRNGFT